MIKFLEKNLYFLIFTVYYAALYLLGPVLNGVLNGMGYYKSFDFTVLYQGFVFYLIFFFFYIFSKNFQLVGASKYLTFYRDKSRPPSIYLIPLVISSVSGLIYFIHNGLVIIGLESYEDRYNSNFGYGIYSLGLQFFYFFVAGILIYRSDFGGGKLFFIVLVYAAFTFALLGGHRQLGMGLIIGLFIYFSMQRRISLRIFVLLALILIPVSIISALLRYDFKYASLNEIFLSLIIFFYDGVTPIDAHVDIYRYFMRNGSVGGEIVINQFLSYVPRFFWEEKPAVMMNGGNFFSLFVLNRFSVVTYSPTMLGELLLVHGHWMYLMAPVLAFIIRWVDSLVSRRDFLGVTLVLFSFTLCFNLYREGFYVFVSKLSVVVLFVYMLQFLSKFKFRKFRV